MTDNFPFLTDILAQPQALQDVLEGYDPQMLEPLSQKLAAGDFDRVIITGMGASTFGTYPAWLHLLQAGIPAFWMDTSEVLAYAPQVITPRTLLWVVSNSGKSIEITRLLNRLVEFGSPFVLANTNNPESPLALGANLAVPLYTGDDLTLSTRSYVGVLAVTQLMALNLAGRSVEGELGDLRYTLDGMRAYLDGYEDHMTRLDQLVGQVERISLVGRGPSLATALEGALCIQEGPKVHVHGLSTGQFWHGPVEVADQAYTLLALAGEEINRKEDRHLALKAASLGAKVIWLSEQPDLELPTALLPAWRGIGLPIAEIVPIQLIAINLGQQSGFRPGDFRYLGKTVNTKLDDYSQG